MPKYRAWFHTYASGWVEFDADDDEAAAREAENIDPGGICGQCAGAWRHDREGIELSDWEPDNAPDVNPIEGYIERMGESEDDE